MPDKRVTCWVCRFADRKALMLQWVDPDTDRTKSRSARTDNAKEAEKARADLEYELNHGQYQESSRMAWSRFREIFEADYVATRRPNTRRSYECTLDAFEEICQPARLRSVEERMLSQFATGLRERETTRSEGNRPSTVKVRLQYLRTAIRWAVKQKMLPSCPVFPKVKVEKKRPQPIPAESFEKLYAKAPDAQMKAFLLSGWLAGLRLSEALALEREPTDTAPYLDLAHDRIVLPAGFVKAGEDQWVPLDPVLREAFLALPEKGPRLFYFRAKDGHELDFTTVSERIVQLAAKAGVKLTMHTLRKGFGCRYAARVPAQVLQRLMRHANIATTMDYYANVDEAAMQAVLGKNRQVSADSHNSFPNREPSRQESGLPKSLPREGF
jgi:integrase